MGAFDDAGDVRDDKGAIVRQVDHAQVGRQRGKGIVRDSGLGVADPRQQGGLARVGLADQADVGQQFELEADHALLALPTRLPPPRRLLRGRREAGVPPASSATLRDHQHVVRLQQLAQDFAGAVEVYEQILDMGSKAPPLHREISNESLAMIYFFQKDYEKSLKYQRDWLDTSSWVAEACPKVCPARRSDSLAVEATRPAPAGIGSRSANRGDTRSDPEIVAPAAVRAPSGSE